MSIFGFSTEAPTGDFTPIVKYDARAGRIFRVDRTDTGNGFESSPIDITNSFKAVCDFENLETGWIDFSTGGAPSFVLVPRGQMLPPRPSTTHKNGVRFMIKLGKDCGGDKPVREIAGTSRAFLNGTQTVVEQWLREAKDHPGQLPVIVLDKTTPVKTGSGDKSSTNYHPTWKIIGWAPRPADLVAKGRGSDQHPPQQTQAPLNGGGINTGAAPATGNQRPAQPQQQAPQQPAQPTVAPDDFG
jgi:hypothetical protein